MQLPLQIAFRGIPASAALEARIGECVEKLEKVHPRLLSCRVAVESPGHHRSHGRHFAVHVELQALDKPHAINARHEHEDVYVALRDAFDAARHQLQAG